MVKARVKKILDSCFIEGVKQELWSAGAAGSYTVELPKHASHGDFSTNMAMIMAGREKRIPVSWLPSLPQSFLNILSSLTRLRLPGPVLSIYLLGTRFGSR